MGGYYNLFTTTSIVITLTCLLIRRKHLLRHLYLVLLVEDLICTAEIILGEDLLSVVILESDWFKLEAFTGLGDSNAFLFILIFILSVLEFLDDSLLLDRAGRKLRS